MSEKKAVRQSPSRKIERLLKLLDEQRRVLITANSDKKLIAEYEALVKFLKSASTQELKQIFTGLPVIGKSVIRDDPYLAHDQVSFLHIEGDNFLSLSTSELEKLVLDEKTSRRQLEQIAINRFKVPKGSIRSFSNRGLLVDKLMTLLLNEKAHTAIEAVAKRQL